MITVYEGLFPEENTQPTGPLSLLLRSLDASLLGTCPDPHRPHLCKHWNLEILSDDLIQVFHLTARKQHCQVTCHHPLGHSIHSWARLLSPRGQVQGNK